MALPSPYIVTSNNSVVECFIFTFTVYFSRIPIANIGFFSFYFLILYFRISSCGDGSDKLVKDRREDDDTQDVVKTYSLIVRQHVAAVSSNLIISTYVLLTYSTIT